MSQPLGPEIDKLHEEACADGRESYRDPKTGYQVFTRLTHLKRGYCCKSGCRHCPYQNPGEVEDPTRIPK